MFSRVTYGRLIPLFFCLLSLIFVEQVPLKSKWVGSHFPASLRKVLPNFLCRFWKIAENVNALGLADGGRFVYRRRIDVASSAVLITNGLTDHLLIVSSFDR